MADMRLHRLLREEEPLADLAVDEAVSDELQDLDLASGGILADLTLRRRREGNHCATASRAATCCSRLEPATVVAITVQDLLALSGVHESGIGVAATPL
jgi:hypothetical protein